MPKLYIATVTSQPDGGQAKTMATGSMTTLKERLRAFPETEWEIKTAKIKADVPTICALVEGQLPPVESTEAVRINSSGQVRAIK